MSRKTIFIISVLIYFLACGKSCDEGEQRELNREKEAVNVTIDSLRGIFETDVLSVELLGAFEASAMMKFRDFSDYYRIASDTSAAEIFRAQARKMILSSFLREKDLPDMSPFTLNSVDVGEPFHQINDTLYKGTLHFTATPVSSFRGDSINHPASGIAGIFLTRHPKPFGSDTLKVWDVFLGEIQVGN